MKHNYENPFIEKRKQSKIKLMELYDSLKDTNDKARIIGLFCLNTGIKLKTAEEYWTELQMAGLIK